MTRYVFDTEFMEDGDRIELLSIGIVADDGNPDSDITFYAENAEADHSHANEWVRENVLPHLIGGAVSMSRAEIAAVIREFIEDTNYEGAPEFWAYYADYDWVVLCQLFGRMIDLPDGWPMFCMDIKQRADDLGNPKLPEQGTTEHHALNDARWGLEALNFLDTLLDDTILAIGHPKPGHVETPAHLVPTLTERGFKWMPPVGSVVLYESSLASRPKIWLKINLGDPDEPKAAQLDLDQAARLRDQLDWLIHHHYQVEEADDA